MKSHSDNEQFAQNHGTRREPTRVQRRVTTVTPIGRFDYRRSDELVHRGLATRNLRRRSPTDLVGHDDIEAVNNELRELAAMQYVENKFVSDALTFVAQHAAEAPVDADGFIGWLGHLRHSGPGQLDPILTWLSNCADEEALRWHVQQELAADVGTNELIATVRAMGHTPRNIIRFADTAALIGVSSLESTDIICWEALARSNLVIALASTRRWANHAIGALVAFMMTSSQRVATLENALRRLGYEIYPPTRTYDPSDVADLVRHALAIGPPSTRAIAEGALMWMHFQVRCQERYRDQLVA